MIHKEIHNSSLKRHYQTPATDSIVRQHWFYQVNKIGLITRKIGCITTKVNCNSDRAKELHLIVFERNVHKKRVLTYLNI